MTEERKADVDAAMAYIEYEMWLALKQNVIAPPFHDGRTVRHEGKSVHITVSVYETEPVTAKKGGVIKDHIG